jgi:outer membrane protein OmpA-like peptidoglycan-associated protein
MDLGPLTEILQIGDELRRSALDRLGPLAPMVTAAGQIVTAALALGALAFGRSFWAPPTGLSHFAVRVGGLLAGAGMVGLYIWSVNGGTPLTFLVVGFGGILFGAIAALVYYRWWSLLCFKCPGRTIVYVKGLELTENAKKVLAGKGEGVFEPVGAPPASAVQYFCNTNTDADPVWTPDSHVRAEMRLITRYLLFMVPMLVGLASTSVALTQPEYKVEANTIFLPGDVLFDFNKAEIRPGAVITLEEAAKLMQKRKVASARIEGHTDEIGNESVNRTLSRRRAEAVRAWLTTQGGLNKVRFTVEGRGATQPVAPNKNADGSDNPDGRAKNRRVTIVLGE